MKTLPPNATTWTAVSLIALGLIMIFLAWNGVAGPEAAVDVRAQFPYLISGGVFGLSLVGAGLTLVRVFESRRDAKEIAREVRRLVQVVERLEQAHADAQLAQANAREAMVDAPPPPMAPPRPVPTAPFEPMR